MEQGVGQTACPAWVFLQPRPTESEFTEVLPFSAVSSSHAMRPIAV